MASITLTVPDAIAQRVLDGFASQKGYTGTAPDGTAETKAQFLKRKLGEHVREIVLRAEMQAAAAAAGAAAQRKADAEISIS